MMGTKRACPSYGLWTVDKSFSLFIKGRFRLPLPPVPSISKEKQY